MLCDGPECSLVTFFEQKSLRLSLFLRILVSWVPVSGYTQGRDHSEGMDRMDLEVLSEVKHGTGHDVLPDEHPDGKSSPCE